MALFLLVPRFIRFCSLCALFAAFSLLFSASAFAVTQVMFYAYDSNSLVDAVVIDSSVVIPPECSRRTDLDLYVNQTRFLGFGYKCDFEDDETRDAWLLSLSGIEVAESAATGIDPELLALLYKFLLAFGFHFLCFLILQSL